jgi:hypothetical protein
LLTEMPARCFASEHHLELLLRKPRLRPNVSKHGHYRIYQLDPFDHIKAGFSVECGSDTAAMREGSHTPGTFSGVEVWKKSNCLAHLSTPGRGRAALRNPWSA